jgi:RNA polymerase sigma-70 factor (ECF subfamily)
MEQQPTMSTAQTLDLTDEDLVRKAKEMRPDVWDYIYDTFYPKMYRYLYLHLDDRSAAEDLAGDVFEQAVRGIARFRYEGVPLSSWLYRIAHHLLVDFIRARKRAPSAPIENIEPPSVAGFDELSELRHDIREAMSHLTTEQRQVLILRQFEGYDVETTGRIMGKKNDAVKSLHFRAVNSLRRLMEGRGQDR